MIFLTAPTRLSDLEIPLSSPGPSQPASALQVHTCLPGSSKPSRPRGPQHRNLPTPSHTSSEFPALRTAARDRTSRPPPIGYPSPIQSAHAEFWRRPRVFQGSSQLRWILRCSPRSSPERSAIGSPRRTRNLDAQNIDIGCEPPRVFQIRGSKWAVSEEAR